MTDATIKRMCIGCKHSILILQPDESIRMAACSHARDTSAQPMKSRPRAQDAKLMPACPLEEVRAVAA